MADRLGLFQRITAVHFGAGGDFDVAPSSTAQLPSEDGTPPIIIWSIETVPPDAVQETTTSVDHTEDGGLGTLLRTYGRIIRITGATKVTLHISSPPGTDHLGFVGIGSITFGGTTISALIRPAITPDPAEATSMTADPTIEHPTGVLLDTSSGSADLVFLDSDPPRPR